MRWILILGLLSPHSKADTAAVADLVCSSLIFSSLTTFETQFEKKKTKRFHRIQKLADPFYKDLQKTNTPDERKAVFKNSSSKLMAAIKKEFPEVHKECQKLGEATSRCSKAGNTGMEQCLETNGKEILPKLKKLITE